MNLTQLLITQKNVDEISAKFGLSEEQTLEAMAAVIPAFSEGLKRQAANPQGAAGLVQALASGRHAMYVEDPRNAVSQEGVQDGNAILGHLFGNKDVSRGVAAHAAASTGIGSSIIKSLLPVIASMVMGSIFKGSSRGRSGGGGLLGKIIEGIAGGMLGGGAATQRQRRLPSGRQQPGSLEDLLGQVLGGGSAPRQRSPMPRSRQRTSQRTQRRQTPGGGLGGLLEEMLGGGRSGRQRRQTRQRDPIMPQQRRTRRHQRQAPPSGGGGLSDIFGDMLEPGGNTSQEYRRGTQSVFDEFLKG